MKTPIFSNTALILAASAAFMFSGCNSDGLGLDRASADQIPSAQQAQATPNTSKEVKAQTQTPDRDTQTAQQETVQTSVVSRVSQEQKAAFLDAINAARAETQDCGSEGIFDPAPALSWNDRLGNAAWEHSYDMAQSDTFSHTGSGEKSDITAQQMHLGHGSNFRDRIENQGYNNYRIIGENIAAGYVTAEEVVEGWIQSDHHCANLMNPKFSEVGMALVEKFDTDFGYYWSQELGGK